MRVYLCQLHQTEHVVVYIAFTQTSRDIKIRIAIYGYGNLGRGVECAAKQNPDVELIGVFT
ncbi:MAG: hypothetical protein J6X44_03785, partial [Thermoguttaceae bacterium]|nr:hypothetical protein [Thermoguttaceae bacterium]